MDISIQPNLNQTGITAKIPCCLCGSLTIPNSAYQCAPCLASQFDLQPLLSTKLGDVHQCRRCLRFECGNNRWEPYELESHGLMGICLKKVHALQTSHNTLQNDAVGAAGSGNVGKLKLVDASWVWTEPHSMRLKVRLTVQANVLDDTITIQQRAVVELVIRWQQCPECNKNFTNQQWHAIVQVRQKRSHVAEGSVPKGLLMLEMTLANAKHARRHVLDMKTMQSGFDFYFSRLDKAQSFASFIAKTAPMRIKSSSKLVSTDNHNNTANIKTTVVCDMVPLCRDDLVVCDKRAKDGAAGRLCGRLAVVSKVSSCVHLIDASPPRDVKLFEDISSELVPEKYWKSEKFYRVVLPPKRMIRFVVLDVEVYDGGDDTLLYEGAKTSSDVKKYALADVEIAREVDFGQNDITFQCTTHLGNLLNVGDFCLGYDLTASTSDDTDDLSSYNKGFELPDVVLVKKIQGYIGEEAIESSHKDESTSGEKKKTKSSKSKRREKRRAKEEQKERTYNETVARMGFLDEVAAARAEFEQELLLDPTLKEELELAEESIDGLCLDDSSDQDENTNREED